MRIPDNIIASPAVILRPTLRTRSGETGTSYVGGMPHLPDSDDWPTFGADDTPYHFFMQIDLSSLPTELIVAGTTWPMQDFPRTGFLLVFLPLQIDMISDNPPVILFFEDLKDCHAVAPPFDLPALQSDDFVDMDAVTDCGKMLRQSPLSFLPCMSVRAVAPHTDEIATPLTPEMKEAISQKHPKVVLRKPQSGADKAIALADRYEEMQASMRLPVLDNRQSVSNSEPHETIAHWSAAFEFSRHFLIALLEEVLRVTKGKAQAGVGGRRMREAAIRSETLLAQMTSLNANDASHRIPPLSIQQIGIFRKGLYRLLAQVNTIEDDPVDKQAVEWMQLAANRTDQMDQSDVIDFAQFVQRIVWLADEKKTVKLQMLNGLRRIPVKAGKLRKSVERAMAAAQKISSASTVEVVETSSDMTNSADLLWQAKVAEQTQSADTKIFGGETKQLLQMFGQGDMVQSAAYDNRDKVMLLQFGNNFGTGIDYGDVAIQVWISPEDLRQRRFDCIEWTVETT